MENTTKRTYSAPQLTEYGTVEDITRGSGFDFFDFANGRVNDDGNIFGIGGHTSN